MTAQNQGVQINTPDRRIIVVRTDQQPASEHHPVLDEPSMARLRPFTVNISTASGEAIHAIVVEFTIVDANGTSHVVSKFYDGPNDGKFAVVRAGSSTAFWPNGNMPRTPPPDRPNAQPIISGASPETADLLEKAQVVTVSVPFIEFADGTVFDAGGWTAKVAQSRQARAERQAKRAQERRKQ
jgi:hypothetical protein